MGDEELIPLKSAYERDWERERGGSERMKKAVALPIVRVEEVEATPSSSLASLLTPGSGGQRRRSEAAGGGRSGLLLSPSMSSWKPGGSTEESRRCSWTDGQRSPPRSRSPSALSSRGSVRRNTVAVATFPHDRVEYQSCGLWPVERSAEVVAVLSSLLSAAGFAASVVAFLGGEVMREILVGLAVFHLESFQLFSCPHPNCSLSRDYLFRFHLSQVGPIYESQESSHVNF